MLADCRFDGMLDNYRIECGVQAFGNEVKMLKEVDNVDQITPELDYFRN